MSILRIINFNNDTNAFIKYFENLISYKFNIILYVIKTNSTILPYKQHALM